jgi:hypothetical protein
MFGKLKNISEAGSFHLTTPSKLQSRNGFRNRASRSVARAWKNLIVRYDKCLNKFGNYMGEQQTRV